MPKLYEKSVFSGELVLNIGILADWSAARFFYICTISHRYKRRSAPGVGRLRKGSLLRDVLGDLDKVETTIVGVDPEDLVVGRDRVSVVRNDLVDHLVAEAPPQLRHQPVVVELVARCA